MKHSLKLRRAVEVALDQAFHAILCEYADEFSRDAGPEMWTDEQKRIWDAITDSQHRAKVAVMEAFESS